MDDCKKAQLLCKHYWEDYQFGFSFAAHPVIKGGDLISSVDSVTPNCSALNVADFVVSVDGQSIGFRMYGGIRGKQCLIEIKCITAAGKKIAGYAPILIT